MANKRKKALFVCQPFPAHLRPHAPLIKEFENQGYEVVLATPDKLAQTAQQYGVTHVTAGTDWAAEGTVAADVASRLLTDGNDAFCEEAFGHLAEATKGMYPDVLRVAEEMDPDVIVTEPSALAGYLVGETLNKPVITSDNGLVRLTHDLWEPVMKPKLDEARAMFGLPPEPEGNVPGHFETLVVPTAKELLLNDLELPGFVGFQHENPVSKGWRLPDAVFKDDSKVKIYGMFGSTGSGIPAWSGIFDNSNQTAIAAAAELGDRVELFLSVGRGNVGKYADLGDVPEEEVGTRAFPARGATNVWVTAHTAQPLALEEADVALLHGGYGGLREDVAAGTPAVWAPNQTDQPDNAEQMARNNLGVHLPNPRFASVADMKAAIEEVIERKEEIAENLHELNGRIAALPTLPELVTRIDRCLELGDVTFQALKQPPAGPADGAVDGPVPDGPVTVSGPAGAAAAVQPEGDAEISETEVPVDLGRELGPADMTALVVDQSDSPEAQLVHNDPTDGPTEVSREQLDPADFDKSSSLKQEGLERALQTNGSRDYPRYPSPAADSPSEGPADGPNDGPDDDDSGPAAPASEPDPAPGPLTTGPGDGAATPELSESPTEDEPATSLDHDETSGFSAPDEPDLGDEVTEPTSELTEPTSEIAILDPGDFFADLLESQDGGRGALKPLPEPREAGDEAVTDVPRIEDGLRIRSRWDDLS